MMRKVSSKAFGDLFTVTIIPTLRDNFTYLVRDHHSGQIAAVDVNGDIEPVWRYLQEHHYLTDSKYDFHTILSTHKHWDHTGGNVELKARVLAAQGKAASKSNNASAFEIMGGVEDHVPGCTRPVVEGDAIALGDLSIAVYDIPCHTKGHVMYKVSHTRQPEKGSAVFTGDMVFVAGLGAFFEGNAQDMIRAMQKVYNLNGDNTALDEVTFIYPGHEYTANFMKFAQRIVDEYDPNNADFVTQQREHYAQLVAEGLPSVPSTLADEKKQNVFLRVVDKAFVRLMNKGNEVQLMDYLYNACD